MFFILSKVISFLVMPLGFWLIYLILTWRRFKIPFSWTLVGLFLLLFFSNHYFIRGLIHRWEIPSQDISSYSPKKVGIVLTGGLFTNRTAHESNLHLGTHADRMFQALQLYRVKKIQKILITGGPLDSLYSDGSSESILARQYFLDAGLPEQDIWVENKARNTHENAKFSIQILKNKGVGPNQVYLVTSALHMRRSLACFQKLGWKVQGVSTNPIADSDLKWSWIYLIPNHYAFMDAYQLFHEGIGFCMYKIMGYV